jgi:hypothetical protein
VLVEKFDVRVAAQEPEQFVNDGFGMDFLGRELRKSNRACAPNTEYVPVPVRSALNFPRSRTCRNKSRY